jgi:hypothetical protein
MLQVNILWIILGLLIDPLLSYKLPISFSNKPQTKVYVHLEQFNVKYNLMHIGISFNNINRNVRFDFRAFNDNKSYITTDKDRYYLNLMFPDLDIPNDYDDSDIRKYRELLLNDINSIYSKNILWGITNKTFDEILLYENTLHKKYRIGIYDCRHYVSEFTDWCLDKPTPIWHLHKLWDET